MDKKYIMEVLDEVRDQLLEFKESLPFASDCKSIEKIDYEIYKIITNLRQSERQKFNADEVKIMTWDYQACEFSIKKTLKKLAKKGIRISDKQLRNILQKEGIYKGRYKNND